MKEDPKHINYNNEQFKVPDGYFEDMQQAIKKSTQFDTQEDAFLVPSNYFESFTGELKAKIDDSTSPIRKLNWMKYTSYAVAAGLALFLFFSYFPVQQKCENFSCMLENSELAVDDISWIEAELIEEYYSETLNGETTQNDEALIEYILENDWDVEYLIEQE